MPDEHLSLNNSTKPADGSTGLAGTTVRASPAPLSAGAQGSGWQDIGIVTTFPFLVPVNTTTLPNGTYAVRAICATAAAELCAVAGSAPTSSTVLRTSGDGGGGGYSLQPGGGGTRATALDALGHGGLPLVVLLGLGLQVWRRRAAEGRGTARCTESKRGGGRHD